jgi:NhaP-type Na+/H+ or K+/H+ antiporter
VTTNQILIGIGLILALAVGAQVLASRLHIPAIIVLLPTGFVDVLFHVRGRSAHGRHSN